jgi:hypothetical protein
LVPAVFKVLIFNDKAILLFLTHPTAKKLKIDASKKVFLFRFGSALHPIYHE